MELEINRSAIVDTGFLDLLIFRQRPSELTGQLKSQATAQSRITVLELIQPRKQNSLVASIHFSEVCEEGENLNQRSFILQEFKIDDFLDTIKAYYEKEKRLTVQFTDDLTGNVNFEFIRLRPSIC